MAPARASAAKLLWRWPLPRCERMGVEVGDAGKRVGGKEGGRNRQAMGEAREGPTGLTAHGDRNEKRYLQGSRRGMARDGKGMYEPQIAFYTVIVCEFFRYRH